MTAPVRTITRTTNSEQETDRLAGALARHLRPGDVVALHGELGAGKTRFVRGLARGRGIDPSLVSSPTYVLMQEYEGAAAVGSGGAIIHIDAYRLPPGDDLSSLGLDAAALDEAILVIEWAERVIESLPAQRFEITITHAGGDARGISITPPAGRDIRLEESESWRCRACGRPIEAGARHFPFCSDRCRMSDLNKWFSGDYLISREIKDADLDALE